MEKKILIIYAPQGGYTEKIAFEMSKKFTTFSCALISGIDLTNENLDNYSNIIIGIATLGNDAWNSKNQDPDSANIQKIISQYDFSDKNIALFGLGNSILYPSHFVDDMGIYEEQLLKQNAKIIGYTNSKNYTFKDSKALRGEFLCGLAIDNDTEPEKTNDKISQWISDLIKQLK
jgi:flavodoxin I